MPSYPAWPQAVGWWESWGSTDFIGPIYMKKNCPGKKSLSSFSDQLYENKTDPFAQANNARACSDCLKQRSSTLSKCLCEVMLAPYLRKDDWSRRGTLLAERKCMKRWRSGWLKTKSNPYTPDNVSTYKRGLACLPVIGVVTWPKYWLSQFIPGKKTALAFESLGLSVVRVQSVSKAVPLYLSSIVRTELTSFWEESHKEEKVYIMGNVHSHEDEGKLAFFKKNAIHATSTFPIMHLICPRKFHFSWVLKLSQEKLKTALMQNFWGQIRCIMGIVKVA